MRRSGNAKRFKLIAVFIGGLLMGTPVVFGTDQGFLSVDGPCNFSFPRDHGAHAGFRTEWWYYTGNLTGSGRRDFGFQLTFFRRQIAPPQDKKNWPVPGSAWRTQQIYLAHAALSDISNNDHLYSEAVARNALGMAGVEQNKDKTVIFLGSWSATIIESLHTIEAKADEFAYRLNLVPVKQPVFHGEEGYSLKGSSPERASCYYSFTRMDAEGIVSLGDKAMPVKGTGWMDHEFSTAPLESGIQGWDWFSLQLSDQTEIMIFLLREPGGGLNKASSGTFVTADGGTRHLTVDDFKISVLDTWQSRISKATYPIAWEMKINPLDISLRISANAKDQEMTTEQSTGVIYWEGSVSVGGKRQSNSVTGRGYVELTGYGQSFEIDL